MAEFPSDWGLAGDTQRFIACWETLAQQALLELRAQTVRGFCQEVVYKQDCDNSPAEGAGNKLFTTSPPSSTLSSLLLESWLLSISKL